MTSNTNTHTTRHIDTCPGFETWPAPIVLACMRDGAGSSGDVSLMRSWWKEPSWLEHITLDHFIDQQGVT